MLIPETLKKKSYFSVHGISLFLFFSFWQQTEAQAGSAGTSAQKKKKKKKRKERKKKKKKRKEKSEERKIEAQMALNILKTSMMKSSEIEYLGTGQPSL